jgi:hypothetical protein
MIKRSIPKLVTVSAIAMAIVTLDTTATLSQTAPETETTPTPTPKVTFVCGTNSSPPTTYALTQDEQGKSTLEPLLSWHSEYLYSGTSAEALCQQMAQTLQSKYDKGEPMLPAAVRVPIKDETTGENTYRMDVCLVASEQEQCDASGQSGVLFSLNGSYDDTLKCVVENTKPEVCRPRTRGALMAIPASKYRRGWLSLFF